MSRIIRAKVNSNSCEDTDARVKLICPDIWDDVPDAPLIESVGGIPLKKDDIVYVDVSDGFENPIIIGRAMGSLNTYGKELNGSLLFESSDGENFTIAFVKCNKLEMYNSDGIAVTLDALNIHVKSDKVTCDIDGVGIKVKADTFEAEYSNSYKRKSSEAMLEDDTLTVKTKSGKVTGGTFEMKGTAAPESTGPFCGIPACLFTGAPHVGTKVSGT